MNSVVQQRKKKSKGKQDRLNTLWEQTERLQDENAQLRERLDELIHRIRRELAPVQAEEAQAARDLILHLLPFLQRKSLAKWQRVEIHDWIDEQLQLVAAAGLMDETLDDALAREWARQRGMEIDETSPLSPAEQVEAAAHQERETEKAEFEQARKQAFDPIDTVIEEEVEARVREQFGSTSSPPPKAAVDDLFADEIDAAERARQEEIERFRQEARREIRERIAAEFSGAFGGFHEAFGDFDDAAPDDGGQDEDPQRGASPQPTLDRSVLDRLFRRTANVLHPDKEGDDARRLGKQDLMGSLLEARKNGDILTVFKLHQEHASSSPDVGAGDERELIAALEQQIQKLEREREEIIRKSPAHANVYRDFYGLPEKKIKREIAEIKKGARQQNQYARKCVREIKTLKTLKPVLAERRDERLSAFPFDISIDEPF